MAKLSSVEAARKQLVEIKTVEALHIASLFFGRIPD